MRRSRHDDQSLCLCMWREKARPLTLPDVSACRLGSRGLRHAVLDRPIFFSTVPLLQRQRQHLIPTPTLSGSVDFGHLQLSTLESVSSFYLLPILSPHSPRHDCWFDLMVLNSACSANHQFSTSHSNHKRTWSKCCHQRETGQISSPTLLICHQDHRRRRHVFCIQQTGSP
jgi:hypothetical protein